MERLLRRLGHARVGRGSEKRDDGDQVARFEARHDAPCGHVLQGHGPVRIEDFLRAEGQLRDVDGRDHVASLL